jgi:hypothetical protein
MRAVRPSLFLRRVPFAAAVAVALSSVVACKPANMSGSGGKKSGARDDNAGEGQELGNSAPGEGDVKTDGVVSTVTTSGTGTGTGEYNDSPVTMPASMSGAFLICPMVETTGRSEVGSDEDLFGCAATPDGKDLLPLDGYDVAWHVKDDLGNALAATELAAPSRSLFHRLFVLEKDKIHSTTRVVASVTDRATSQKIKDLEGLVLVDKRAPFPQEGDADTPTNCTICQHDGGTGTGTGGQP